MDNQAHYCKLKDDSSEGLDIIVSSTYYAVQCLLIIPTIFVNMLVLRMLKRDQMHIAVELKVYSIGNIIVGIGSIINQGIIKFAFPACYHLGNWYCHLSTALMAIGMFRELVHSMTLSLYRYVFIIHNEKINTEKDRKRIGWLIFSIKWFTVIIFAIKVVIFNKDEFALYFASLCKGEVEMSSGDQSNMTAMEFLVERAFYRVPKEDNNAIVTNFGIIRGKLAILMKAFCVIVDALIMGGTLNLMEGFLYSRIAKFMKVLSTFGNELL